MPKFHGFNIFPKPTYVVFYAAKYRTNCFKYRDIFAELESLDIYRSSNQISTTFDSILTNFLIFLPNFDQIPKFYLYFFFLNTEIVNGILTVWNNLL